MSDTLSVGFITHFKPLRGRHTRSIDWKRLKPTGPVGVATRHRTLRTHSSWFNKDFIRDQGGAHRHGTGDAGGSSSEGGQNAPVSWTQQLLQDLGFKAADIKNRRDPKSENEGTGEEGFEKMWSSVFTEQDPIGEDKSQQQAGDQIDELIEDDEKFRAWQLRREALDELEEYTKGGADPDEKHWEDWLDDQTRAAPVDLGGWFDPVPDWEEDGLPRPPPKLPERGMRRTMKELMPKVFQNNEEVEQELTFEEKIFRYSSQTTAKFFSCLVLIPVLTGMAVHDFVLVPFIDRWVETAPLIATVLDVRESQKIKMIEELKLERQRVRFEAVIGKTPPLDEEELAEHMHEEALHLQDEFREENRKAFANIWSDALAGGTGFLICVLRPREMQIMRITGDRIFTNISDTGKAFIIILCTDIFLGYHSAFGWETLIELFLEHYGLETDEASIYIFVATVPVTLDTCFKLWVFRYLNRLSPSAAATFREMKRH
eukprot:TRINITY_DN6408_c0_g1_i1.p1 TRINITY_DN6408_c0_g1~~TRINITY_DN6408_c0_g1_i1.p1  ORF type:complete len:487 (-),score=93.17 TRINITY_DN6408_c0_g1_i1:320-1780(-)